MMERLGGRGRPQAADECRHRDEQGGGGTIVEQGDRSGNAHRLTLGGSDELHRNRTDTAKQLCTAERFPSVVTGTQRTTAAS
jgi:hypothetical protein